MNYIDYSALIQLGVVFNFAFVYESFEPVRLFKQLFLSMKQEIVSSDKEIEGRIILLDQSIKSLSLEEQLKKELKKKLDLLHEKINRDRMYIEIRLNRSPVYFHNVCLMLAMYSIILLFFLADYNSNLLSRRAWPIFTIIITLGLIYYLTKEILSFVSLISKPIKDTKLKVITILLISFFVSYIISFLFNYSVIKLLYDNLPILEKLSEPIRYCSLFVPFTSFLVCFLLHLFSVIYAKIKIFITTIRINRLREKQNQIFDRKKDDVKFDFH